MKNGLFTKIKNTFVKDEKKETLEEFEDRVEKKLNLLKIKLNSQLELTQVEIIKTTARLKELNELESNIVKQLNTINKN